MKYISPFNLFIIFSMTNYSAIHGEKALFSRNRLYLAGQKLKFKDSILDHLNLGEKLFCDMVSMKELRGILNQ